MGFLDIFGILSTSIAHFFIGFGQQAERQFDFLFALFYSRLLDCLIRFPLREYRLGVHYQRQNIIKFQDKPNNQLSLNCYNSFSNKIDLMILFSEGNNVHLIKQSPLNTITMIIPASMNSFLIVRTDNSYELRSIRESECMLTGKLPQQFVPSAIVKPIYRCGEPYVFLFDREGNVCRLNIREGKCQLRDKVSPGILLDARIGKDSSIHFKILDEQCRFLLGWSVQAQSLNTLIFIYDWQSKKYSPTITLPKSYFNFKIFNQLEEKSNNMDSETVHKKLIFFATGQKYDTIFCSLAEFSVLEGEMIFKTVERKQVKVSFVYFPIGGVYVAPHVYAICNSPSKGMCILKYNLEENADKRGYLTFSRPSKYRSAKKTSGLLRNFLGIVDQNLLFTYKQNGEEQKKIIRVPLDNSLFNLKMNDYIIAYDVGEGQEEDLVVRKGELKDFDEITPSLDGFSFQQYRFELGGSAKKSNSTDMETFLRVSTTFRIPKKYYYSQLAEKLDLSPNLTSELLALL